MSATYANVFPMSQQETYLSQNNVDFILQLDQSKLLPGSLVVEGEVAVFTNKDSNTAYAGEDLMYDARAGYHGLFRDLTVETQTSGILESLLNYPRLVKMATVALTLDESLGSESVNSLEGKLMNNEQTRGTFYGRSTTNRYVPFSVKPMFCLNKASGPIAGSATGQIRIRFRLSPDNEFLFGSDFTGTTGYKIQKLRLRYMTVPDDMKKQEVQMETYQTFRSSIDSTNSNVSTYIPGLCSAVHMSFIAQADEGIDTKNYLQLALPPGKAPYAYSSVYTGKAYGVERLTYAVSDVDSALVNFTLESREELVHNGMRSFAMSGNKYGALIRHFNEVDGDCYVLGIPFGGLIDFSKNKFSVEVQTQCSAQTAHVVYIYARCLNTIQA